MEFELRVRPTVVRVLALDDDGNVWRRRIHESLTAHGILCDTVHDLSQFNKALRSSEYDVASIDCVIGDADVQEESLRMLRQGDPDIGKIVFSAMVGDPRIEMEAKYWGADYVVEKQAFGGDEHYVDAVFEVARFACFRRVLTLLRPGSRRDQFAGSWPKQLTEDQERQVYAEAVDALISSFLEGEENSELMNVLKRRGVLRQFDSPRYLNLPFQAKLAELLSYALLTPEQLSQILGVDTATAVRLLAGDEHCVLTGETQENAYWLASILGFVLRLADDMPDVVPAFWTAQNLYAKSRNPAPWDSDGLRDYLVKNGRRGLNEGLRWIRNYEGE